MAKKSQHRIDPGAYAAFVKQVELERIILEEAAFRRFGTPAADKPLSFELKQTKLHYLPSAEGFSATVRYLVKLHQDDPAEPFGEIRTVHTAFYSSESTMTDEVFDVFGELNVPLNVFPFVREFVHSATYRMGFPVLVLPTVKRG